MRPSPFRRWLVRLAALAAAAILIPLVVSQYVKQTGSSAVTSGPEAAPPAQVALVLGAGVYANGQPSPMLADRLEVAARLYHAGRVRKVLVTGDHGREDYDEVNVMARYLESRGVPPADIFLDHAGFDTYDSLYRAREVFHVESALVVTQRFHLPRAMYIARALGLEAAGVPADLRLYAGTDWYEWREVAARNKAFWEASILRRQPRFLGPAMPVTGDGRVTRDR